MNSKREEKMFSKPVSLLIAMSFLLISTAVAFADEKPYQARQPIAVPSTGPSTVAPLPQAFNCPSGWHRKPGTAQYVCVPNKPAPIKCPEVPGKVYKYYEALTCTGTEGGGTFRATCGGCELGCADVTPPR